MYNFSLLELECLQTYSKVRLGCEVDSVLNRWYHLDCQNMTLFVTYENRLFETLPRFTLFCDPL